MPNSWGKDKSRRQPMPGVVDLLASLNETVLGPYWTAMHGSGEGFGGEVGYRRRHHAGQPRVCQVVRSNRCVFPGMCIVSLLSGLQPPKDAETTEAYASPVAMLLKQTLDVPKSGKGAINLALEASGAPTGVYLSVWPWDQRESILSL